MRVMDLKGRLRKKIAEILGHKATPYVVLIILSSFILMPIFLMVISSVKPLHELTGGVTYLPKEVAVKPWIAAFSKAPLLPWIKNSFLLAIGAASMGSVAALFTGYGLSKYKYPGSGGVLLFFLFSRLFPPVSLLAGYYMLLRSLHLINTIFGLMLYNTYIVFPILVWLYKGFFDTFPDDLIEAAYIDGCSRMGAFTRVVLPMTSASIIAGFMLAFLFAWNEFIGAFMFINTDLVKPVTVGIFWFVGDEAIQWNQLFVCGTVTIIPTMLFFLALQKYLIRGIITGAVR